MHKLAPSKGRVLVKILDGSEYQLSVGTDNNGLDTLGIGAPKKADATYPDGIDKDQRRIKLYRRSRIHAPAPLE
jgi:hypothetical protein